MLASREPTIRNLEPRDVPECARIFDSAWRVGHPYAPRVIDEATLRRETLGELTLVADVAGVSVGFVSVYMPERFIHHLYVDPAASGRGVGRALLAAAVSLAGGAASLKCQTANETALAFYKALGWTEHETGEAESGPWVRMRSPTS